MQEASVNKFKQSLSNPDTFTVTWEQVPGRINTRKQLNALLDNSREAAAGGIVTAISITDSPGGTPALLSEVVAIEVQKLGVEPLVHIALLDKNRTQIESILYNLHLNDIRNVLVKAEIILRLRLIRIQPCRRSIRSGACHGSYPMSECRSGI